LLRIDYVADAIDRCFSAIKGKIFSLDLALPRKGVILEDLASIPSVLDPPGAAEIVDSPVKTFRGRALDAPKILRCYESSSFKPFLRRLAASSVK
jgi:hypothetical protein